MQFERTRVLGIPINWKEGDEESPVHPRIPTSIRDPRNIAGPVSQQPLNAATAGPDMSTPGVPPANQVPTKLLYEPTLVALMAAVSNPLNSQLRKLHSYTFEMSNPIAAAPTPSPCNLRVLH